MMGVLEGSDRRRVLEGSDRTGVPGFSLVVR